ncbi:MAG: hypothetical protein R3B06_15775 [Kofleriaceae bacterium]
MVRRSVMSGLVAAGLAACGSRVPPFERAPIVAPPTPVDAGVDAPAPPVDAAPPTAAVDDRQRALGERYAAAHGLRMAGRQVVHIGNTDGVFAPLVAMPDGGVVMVATRVTPRAGRAGLSTATAVRLDPAGARMWERDFVLAGFVESEGGSAMPVADGVIVFVMEYVSPAWGGVTRVAKLDAGTGAVVWDWLGRGQGGAGTPFADTLRLTPGGAVEIDGHIVQKKGQPAQTWRGQLDVTGTLVVDEVGGRFGR